MLDSPIAVNRSNGIDILRAFLAIWVLCSHLSRWTYHVQGDHAHGAVIYSIFSVLVRFFQTCGETHPAVLGFIVLSGYCIHRNGLRRKGTSVKSYFIRRAFRIYPIYMLAIVVGLAGFCFSFTISPEFTSDLSGTKGISLESVALKIIGISAFMAKINENTFQGNAPLHTVMVEIWLYVLYPILLFGVLRKYKERVLWIALFIVWGIGTAYISFHHEYSSWWHNGSIYGFLLYWWIGVKFTDADFTMGISRYYQLLILAWLSLSAVLIFGLTSAAFIVEARKLTFALLFGVYVTKCDRINLSSWFDKIGKAGYSIYALHAPLVYTLIIFGIPWPLVCLGAVLTGMMVYGIYEYPLLRIGKNLAESHKGGFNIISG